MKTLMESFSPVQQQALLALKTRQTNTIQTVLKRQSEELSILENKLLKEIIRYFTRLEKNVLATYKKATEEGIPFHNIQALIHVLIQSWHKEYTPLLLKYKLLLRKLSDKQHEELVELQHRKTLGLNKSKDKLNISPVILLGENPLTLLSIKAQTTLDDLFKEPEHYIIEENKIVTQQIEQANFKFCEKTRQRVTREINEIISHSETEGIGPYQVAEQIQARFGQLKTYEANRIARTEIKRADNTFRYDNIMNDDLIDYIQWHSNIDQKTRGQKKHDKANHIKMNGEIIRKGEVFSNGLRYPGDPNGPAYEVINCRCTPVPWIPPFDKMPPTGKSIFHESDLVDKPDDPEKQFLLETIENTRIFTPSEGGMSIALNNVRISKVNDALANVAASTLAGNLKTRKEIQTTLEELLGINKKPKVTIRNPFKKQPATSAIEDVTVKPIRNNPVKSEEYYDRQINRLEQKIIRFNNRKQELTRRKAQLRNEALEIQNKTNPTEADELLKQKLLTERSRIAQRIKRIDKSIERANTKIEKRKLLKEASEVKPNTQNIPKKLTESEEQQYDELYSKLKDDGGSAGYVPGEMEEPVLELGPLNSLSVEEQETLKSLIKRKYDFLKFGNGPKVEEVKSHYQIIRELEKELRPIKKDISDLNDKIINVSHEVTSAEYNKYPIDDEIQKVKDKIKRLEEPSARFNVNSLSPEKQEEWKKISSEYLDEVLSDAPIPQRIRRLRANVRSFLKRNTPQNKFNINNLTKEEQELYNKLSSVDEEELSFMKRIKLDNLKTKGRLSPQAQKELENLEEELETLKETKKEQINQVIKVQKARRKQLQKQLDKLLEEEKEIELKIGKQHLSNKTKASHAVQPKDSITLSGQKFNKYDGIEDDEDGYHNFCQVYNSQQSNKPYGIRKYSEGSGHFNNHLLLKQEGDADAIEDNILNALVHPESIYKLNDESIITPLNSYDYKDNPQILKDAVKKLKKKLHSGDPKVRKAYDDLYESFEREEQDFLENAVEFNEGIVTYSGQSGKRYGHLQTGDTWVAPKCVSSSLTEEQTNFFLKRRVKADDKPVKLRFFHQKCTKQVVIGERSLHPNEAEIVQLQGQRGRVIGRSREKFEYFGEHWEEITIDVIDILLDCA